MIKALQKGLVTALVALSLFSIWHFVAGQMPSENLAQLGSRPEIARAVDFQPPDRGTPGRLLGAGTRLLEDTSTRSGLSRSAEVQIGDEVLKCPLTALAPILGGLTASDRPTFLVHLPEMPEGQVEFAFAEQDYSGDDITNQAIYSTRFTTRPTHRTIAFRFPAEANMPPLDPEKIYRWQFSFEVLEGKATSRKFFVGSRLVRVSPSEELAKMLKDASPLDRAKLYAENGVWYDALATLYELRLQNPDDPSLAAEWREFLLDAGLDDVADKPLFQATRTDDVPDVIREPF